ncbi:hypothetical protein [Rhodococcus sp. NPDC055024]
MMARTQDITLPEVVTYDGLPASAGGAHSLRAKRPDRAFECLRTFVESCTEPVSLPSWTFEIYKGAPQVPTEQLSSLATELFGGPRHKAPTHTEWNVASGSVNEALDALVAVGPEAVTAYGRSLAALTYSARVRLLDPDTSAPYPDVTPDAFGRFAVDGYGRLLGDSGIRATFGNAASSLSLWLNLPADDRLSPGARHLQDHLPFRLSTKHWRLWRPNRSGDSYRSNKIPSQVLDQV